MQKEILVNQIAYLKKLHKIILNEKPNRFLVLGDTNSSLGAIVQKDWVFQYSIWKLEIDSMMILFLKNQ